MSFSSCCSTSKLYCSVSLSLPSLTLLPVVTKLVTYRVVGLCWGPASSWTVTELLGWQWHCGCPAAGTQSHWNCWLPTVWSDPWRWSAWRDLYPELQTGVHVRAPVVIATEHLCSKYVFASVCVCVMSYLCCNIHNHTLQREAQRPLKAMTLITEIDGTGCYKETLFKTHTVFFIKTI